MSDFPVRSTYDVLQRLTELYDIRNAFLDLDWVERDGQLCVSRAAMFDLLAKREVVYQELLKK